MKLHLPTRLRQALVATFIAVASLSTTLSTGTLVAGVVAVSLASVASAAVVGPAASYETADMMPESGTLSNGYQFIVTIEKNFSFDFSSSDWATIIESKGIGLTVSSAPDHPPYHIKLLAPADSQNKDMVLNYMQASSLWIASGCWVVDADADLVDAGDIYLGGGQLQIKKGVTLSNDFYLGASQTHGVHANLDYSALRVGQWQNTNQTSTLTGTVNVEENTKISFQAGCTLNIAGTLAGSGNIALSVYDGSNHLILSGTTSEYDGVVSGDGSDVDLKLGTAAVHLGGLNGSLAVGLDTVSASTLTLDVAESITLNHTGTVASGISLVKNGAGTQSFTSALTGDVTVNGGSLILTSVAGDVIVNDGGSIKLAALNGLNSLVVKSGATAYLPGVMVSTTSTSWKQDTSYYTAAAGGIDSSLVTVEEGGTVVSSGGAINATNANDLVYADPTCLADDGSLTIERGRVMVCDPDNPTAVAQSIAEASKIILNGGALFSPSAEMAGSTVNYVVDADLEIKQGNGGGTFHAEGNETTVQSDRTTYTGALTGNGWFYKTGAGYVALTGDVSQYGGQFQINAGILDIAGTTSTDRLMTGAGTLNISGTLTKGGDQTLQLNARILSGGKLITARHDMLDYGGNKVLTIEEGGEFVVNHRQTAGGAHFVLNGGTIVGPGGNDVANEYRGLDIHEGATSNMQVTANSLVNTPIKVRGAASTLNAKVDAGDVLSIANRVYGSGVLAIKPYAETAGAAGGTVSITGSGVLECGSATLAANTTLNFNTSGNSTHSAVITGDATSQITKTGTAAITLSGVTNFAGTVRISGGSLGFTQAATLGGLVTDGGCLLVDAAAPAVLTLGAAPAGAITLQIKNVASVADGDVRVFAEGSTMPTNVLIDSTIVTDDSGSWTVGYSNGMLTKISVTAATAGALTWKTDGASNNWGLTTSENWTNASSAAQRWVDASSVTFAGTGESISVVSAVTADSATVSGTGYEWVLGADKLTITNGVTIAENADLTITGASTANFAGVVSGDGTLRLQNAGLVNLKNAVNAGFVIAQAGQGTLNTLVVGEGTALELGNSDHQAAIDNITHLVIEKGGRFDLRHNHDMNAGDDGKTITIAGTGNSVALSGQSSGPAAALSFAYEATNNNMTIGRKIILSDDATIYVGSGKTGKSTGGLDTATHTLTLTGGGTLYVQDTAADGSGVSLTDVTITEASILDLEMRAESLNTLLMHHNTRLSYTRNGTGVETHQGADKLTISNLVVGSASSDQSTLQIKGRGSRMDISKLQGVGTLNLESNQSVGTIASSVLVSGSGQFEGKIALKYTFDGSNRTFVLSTNGHDTLSQAIVELTSTMRTSELGFVLAGDGSQTIQVAGLATGAAMTNAQAYLVSSNLPYSDNGTGSLYGSSDTKCTGISDSVSRTLELVGSGTNTFGGTVLSGVNLLMNGTGTQKFTGNLDAFNGTIEVKKGTLEMAGLGSASAITLAGAGATLRVTETEGVSGKSLTATAVGAVLSADLTMADGSSLALGATDAEWAKTGGLSLNGHKLVIDTAHLGALSANLGTEEYTGEVVQLLTNVAGIEDDDGNAISITGTTKVGDLFKTGSDTSLADYLLNWDSANGTLSLIMKGEIADLVWNDASEQNEWKNAGTHTNWKNGAADSRFALGDNVSFSGTGETVTIVDTVNPLNVTVSSGDYTWAGSGSVEAAGKLTVGTDADTDAVSLTISTTGNKKFAGGVEVKESDTLVVTNATGWEGYVSGAGCFELATGADVGALSQFVSAEKELGMLLLFDEGTSLSVSSTDEPLLSKVDTVQVVDGAKVKVTNDTLLDTNLTLDSSYGASSVEVAADKTATLSGKFTYLSSTDDVAAIKGAGTLILTGGAANHEYDKDSALIVPNEGTLSIESGTLKIDAADSTVGAHLLGSVNGEGTLLLSNGSVEVVAFADTITVEVVTEAAGDVVNVNSMAGSALDSITLVQGTQLTGVQGDITVGGTGGTTSALALTLDAVNVGSASTIATGKNAMIGQTGKLIINDGAVVTLSVDAIASMLNAAATNSESVYLHLTTGTLEVTDAAMGDLVFKSGATSIDLLETFGVRLNGTEGGSLKLRGGAVGIYTAAEDSTESGYKVLSAYQSTVVAPDKTLEMVLDGAANDGSTAVVNNLIGGTDSTLLISNTDDASTARVELKNKLQAIDNPDPAEAVGADTEFAGDIDGTSGVGDVEIVISGDGTLTVGGNVNTAQLTMSEGGLTLNGNDNTIGSLADDGVAAGATTADSTLTVNDLLTVTEAGALTGTVIDGSGTLALENDLLLQDNATLDGVSVELVKSGNGTEGSLSLQEVQDAEVSALSGNGNLQGKDAKLTVTGQGGSFSGTLTAIDSTAPGTNVLTIAQGASQTLDRVTGSTAWSVENAGELTINITNPAVTTGTGTNKPLTLDSLTMKSGSTTTMVLNTDAPAKYLNLQELVVEDGAKVALQSTGLNEIDFGGSITLAYAANGVTVGDDVAVDLGNSTAFKKVKEATLVSSADGKSLVLQTAYHDENQYEKMASSDNAAAGAALLWSVNTGALPNGSALKAVDEAVNALSKQGSAAAAAQADKIMAAVAGSSTAILGSALSSDVERQLRAIRNRTTTMGVAQTEVNEGMPYVNAWLNAEGDHHEMDADGLAAGYTRDSWGGTVGFDVDLTPSFTMGMAVTAMYGDIESEAADKAEGDFDTQYLSLFARYSSNAWTHTFVATVGRADITLDRTVNYGTGIYETTGDTEGTSFGFMYEVGRVFALTEDGDVCLQPVANVTFRHSSVDGYEESGCDATLAVDEQTYSAVTLGVGARLQAVIGTSIYNRASILEARALAKFDMGDRESEADVRLTQGGDTATVKSAELGAFGAEFGVGVTVPVGTNAGSIFVDGSAEIRSGYTNINGTVGYRINF